MLAPDPQATSWTEIAANAANVVSVLLAGCNSVHTWWTGLAGCVLFGYVFYGAGLYPDVTLQVFYVVTGVLGWWAWLHGERGEELPVRRSSLRFLAACGAIGAATALGYGWLFQSYTSAYAPYLDSLIVVFSVMGQLMLMARRIESWWCWLVVNTIAVPLYASRALNVTALVYVGFWVNAVVSLVRWRRMVVPA